MIKIYLKVGPPADIFGAGKNDCNLLS